MVVEKCFIVLGAGPVCSSLSRAVNPPVRDAQHPYGLPHISENMKIKVAIGNSFAIWVAKLVELSHSYVHIWVENPDGSFLWQLPPWHSLFSKNHLHITKFDYCRFGAPWRKRTRFANNLKCICNLSVLCTRDHTHTVLKGCNSKGILWTKVAEPYPHAVANSVALACAVSVGWMRANLDIEKSAHVACKRAAKTGRY